MTSTGGSGEVTSSATTGGSASAPNHTRSAYVVSITPFDDRGELDVTALRAHLRRMRDAGIGVYVGGGGSGEGYTLSSAEHERVMAVAVSELAGAVAVRAMGVEPRS